MADNNPVKFTGKNVDRRNDLTGPEDAEKRSHPNRPEHVSIQQTNRENNQ